MELLSRAECCVKEYDFNLNHCYFSDFILYFLVIVSMEKGLSMEETRQMSSAVCTQGLS